MANNNSDISSKLNELREWFENNPKLPEEIDNLLLQRFFKCMAGDVEETKKLIELNYGLRNKHPNLFINRDPADESVTQVRKATDLVPLPGLTPEGHKLLFFRIVDPDPRKTNSVDEAKIFFMVTDSRFTMMDVESTSNLDSDPDLEDNNDSTERMAKGDVQIVDIGNYTMGHVARTSLLTVRVYMKYLQEAYPVRLRAIHIINCPSYLDKMIAIIKPFISDEVYKMIHFHTNGLESLYDYVPREMLPEEYGGDAGKIEDLKQKWTEVLKEKRDYLMDNKQWKNRQPEQRSRWSWF